MDYYALMEEWLYPTESGREPVDVTFESYGEALDYADSMCEKEMANFRAACRYEPTHPDHYFPKDQLDRDPAGSVITVKNGLEEWWYGVRVIPLTYGLDNWKGV